MQPKEGPSAALVPVLVSCALFMENLDSTILTTAIPTIAREYGVPPLLLKLALTAYLVSLAIFIPVSGWAAERFGTRRIFSGAIVCFTAGSLLCALACSLPQLVAARLVQGAGGAMMVPVARMVLMRRYPKEALMRITTLVTLPALTGPALGPVLGGALTTWGHWRLIFLCNLPFGALGLWAARAALPRDAGVHKRPLDRTGFALCALGLCGLSFALECLGEPFLTGPQLAWLTLASVALLVAYTRHARGHAAPFLPLGAFRVPTFRLGIAANVASRLGVGGIPFLLPLFYQEALQLTPWHAGLLVLPLSVGSVAMRLGVTRMLRRLGFRRLLIGNTVALAAAILPLATVSAETPIWVRVAFAVLYGALASVQFSCMNVLAYVDLDRAAVAQATSIFATVQQFSTGAGVGTAALVVGHLWHRCGWPALSAFHGTFAVLAAITLASSAIFWRLTPEAGSNASGHLVR